jgi:hypothetical protein
MAWRSQSNARAKQLSLTGGLPGPNSLNDPFQTGAEVRKQQALELLKEGRERNKTRSDVGKEVVLSEPEPLSFGLLD